MTAKGLILAQVRTNAEQSLPDLRRFGDVRVRICGMRGGVSRFSLIGQVLSFAGIELMPLGEGCKLLAIHGGVGLTNR